MTAPSDAVLDLPPFPAAGDLPGSLRWQAAACGDRAPLYRELLRSVAADVESGGPATTLLEPYTSDLVVGLRLMAALHRLVLDGALPDLAPFYPSAGGTERPEGAWPVVRQVLADRSDQVAALLPLPVQTNETGRAAVLYAGLLVLAHRTGLPIRLLEIGASAGLNLRADGFGYRTSAGVFGAAESALVLDEPWRGTPPVPLSTPVRVVERRGCDPAPLDPADPGHRRRLESLVWADQLDRLARLRAAFTVAEAVPAPVDRADDTVAWLADRLAETSAGTLTVVWHSVIAPYVDRETWGAVGALLADVGEGATGDAPLARLGFEGEADESGKVRMTARITLWPDGGTRLLGTARDHGMPFVWDGPHLRPGIA
ncbi:DUF2332 domain-containing protein [Cryptosporangium aurantiacum]|uniref:DUF2332 domain-containing protein n=1 Tax=Cryptosporangium aurantiacum TaxID=134849 RepID=A0A1M7QQ77_9ACTN|nr:DUF2332 domain-containing protein [Cryptosporangium aurantiacum]SHN33357.1 hypothetical protein SAMN05443668_105139 [Cryptosporangium aurantiacum]